MSDDKLIEYFNAECYVSVTSYINDIEDIIYPQVRQLEANYKELKEENIDLNISIRKVTDERDSIKSEHEELGKEKELYRQDFLTMSNDFLQKKINLDMAIEALENILNSKKSIGHYAKDITRINIIAIRTLSKLKANQDGE